jgi:hypothetical protein
MFSSILPPSIDNTYRGNKLALWIFGLVIAVRLLQSVMIIFNGHSIAMSVDGIPLDTFSATAAQTVVTMFALSGVSRLVIALLCALALLRYRSAVPFMFAVLMLGYLASSLVLWFLPLAGVGSPPGPGVNEASFVLMIVGFALSLWKRRAHSAV